MRKQLSYILSSILLVSCGSPVISQTGNNGSNVMNSIVGSQGSGITTVSSKSSNNTASTPGLDLGCLPEVDLTNSPIGDLSTTQPPNSCEGDSAQATPSPTPSPSGSPTLPNPIPGL